MSSDLLEFDSYYKSPQETKNPPFPSNAAYTPRTNDLLGFDSSSTSHWPETGKSEWSAQPSKADTVLWNDFGAPTENNGRQPASSTVHDPWGNLGATSNSFQQSTVVSKAFSSNTYGSFPKQGIARQSTLAFFENPGISRSSSFEKYDGPIADYIDKKQKELKPGNIKVASPLPSPSPSPLRFEVNASQNSAPEILFDADDEMDANFDDDDFGEFETADPVNLLDDIPAITPRKPGDASAEPKSQDVLTPQQSPQLYKNNYPVPPKSPSFHDRNPFSDLVLATKQISELTIREHDLSTPIQTPETAWPTHDKKSILPQTRLKTLPQEIEEEWGDFADLPPETPDVEVADNTKTTWSWESKPTTSTQEPITESPPPTNIPPPSILLPIFQQLFDLPRSALFQPVANQPFSLKNRIYSDPSTIEFLRGYLLIAVVAARILAGRKYRWKRDHHLSQAMKIGLAGGKGGMKLAGIDKAEAAREDREASDTVQIWKEQLGRLRSAITVANSSLDSGDKSKKLIIPEINETMPVKSVGIAEGGIAEAKPCVLCGIKREERIAKVDITVEDSFGDFWIQHWGHRDCRNFWQEHSEKLRTH